MVAVIASRSAWCRVRFRSKEIQPVIPHIEVSSCHSCCKRSWGRRRYSINQRVAGFSAHRKISSFETETRCLAADPSTCFKSPCATALIHAGRQPPHVSATQRLTTVDSPPRLTIPGGFTSDDAIDHHRPAPKPDSLFPLTSLAGLTQNRQDSGQAVARAQSVGMLVAQDPTHAVEGVLAELAGLLMLTQLPQGDSEGVGRAESVGMLVAQDPTHAVEGVLAELASLPMLTQLTQGDSKGSGRNQGMGMVVAQDPARAGERV